MAITALWTSVFQTRRTARYSTPDPTSCCPPPLKADDTLRYNGCHHDKKGQIPLSPSIVERRPPGTDTAWWWEYRETVGGWITLGATGMHWLLVVGGWVALFHTLLVAEQTTQSNYTLAECTNSDTKVLWSPFEGCTNSGTKVLWSPFDRLMQ